MKERKNYGITHLCDSRKGKFISGVADFAAAEFGAVMAFIPGPCNHYAGENRLVEEVQGAAACSFVTPSLLRDTWLCVQLVSRLPCFMQARLGKAKIFGIYDAISK